MMKATCLLFLLLVGVAVPFAVVGATRIEIVPISANTIQGRNSIGGHIFNESRQPIENVRIELLDEVDSIIASTRTDSTGRYLFNNLSQGRFQVKVLTHGTDYESQTARVTITNFTISGSTSGTQYEQVHFTLKVRKDVRNPSGPTGTGTVFAQDVPEPARSAYEKAVNNLNDEKTADQGVAGLKEAINFFPTYFLALERLGTEYVKRRQFESALPVLMKALEVNPSGSMCLYALGIAQYNLKQITAAIDSLRSSVSLAPASINSQLWLGIVLMKDKQFEEAETHLKRAYALGGSQIPDVHMYLAQIYSNSKRYKEAADELELFLKEAPDARDSQQIKEAIKQLRAKAK